MQGHRKVLTVRMADGNVIKLEPYDTLPSTAALAKDYAEAGCPDRYVIFSKNHGTASLTGGKLRRPFYSYGESETEFVGLTPAVHVREVDLDDCNVHYREWNFL